MVTTKASDTLCTVVSKNGHPGITQRSQVSSKCVLLDLLKTLEEQLQGRAMVNGNVQNPLWFLAETERNVFLWRNGYSLDDRDLFEFWIDVPGLVEKRLGQLCDFSDENPFMNPLWGSTIIDRSSADREKEYLQSLKDAVLLISAHAHALSQVGSMISEELCDERRVVILPFS